MNADPRFPIGKFIRPKQITSAERAQHLADMAALPERLRTAVQGLAESQLDTPYRDGGWTVRQVIHHVADSHMHSYIRCKFAMSMDSPTIMPYDEQIWAGFADLQLPVDVSLTLLDKLHERWLCFLRSLSEQEMARTLIHPENGPMNLDTVVALYAWHGLHHTAHITRLREQMGW